MHGAKVTWTDASMCQILTKYLAMPHTASFLSNDTIGLFKHHWAPGHPSH